MKSEETVARKETKTSSNMESSGRSDRVDRPSYRRERPSPYPQGPRNLGPRPSSTPRLPPYNRVFVQNIPYEEKWQELKDLFREKVGEVTYVELFTDETGRSRDYDGQLCQKALMRDNHPAAMAMGGVPMHGLPPPMPGPPPMGPLPPLPPPLAMGPGAMGLPPHIPPPIRREAGGDLAHPTNLAGCTVYVANLDYKVTYSKLKEVFSLAGRVIKVDLMLDKDNKSRGMATVTYENQVQAANAISMLNKQKLFDRVMFIKMDEGNPRESPASTRGELPSGLSGIGPSINSRSKEGLPAGLSDVGSRRGGYGDSGNGFGANVGSAPDSLSALAAISELGKSGVSEQAKLAAGLSALSRLGDTLNTSNSGLDLGALSGLGELARLGLSGASRNNDRTIDRLLDERIRMLTGPGSAFADRERIERDIQRVDSRIRDIDRSLERGRDFGLPKDLPPMPPPMNAGNAMQEATVFVRNLPYSVNWQTLRDKFSRCGRVLFAEVKSDNGRSRGYGSVRFETPEQAESAVRHLDGMDMDGRKIMVHLDRKK